VQLDFLHRLVRQRPASQKELALTSQTVPLCFVRNRRARRYVLRVLPDGSARVTIPRGGSQQEAGAFAKRHVAWVEKQLQKHAAPSVLPQSWQHGTEILFRGERVALTIEIGHQRTTVQFANQRVAVAEAHGDLRPTIERHLRRMATVELPVRTLELAAQHRLTVRRVTVRNQRSRWGSCSRKSTLSLNWRLIQTPEFVRDYIILHELMHLREMNHSPRYWREVERVCPDYAKAEQWLKAHRELLR
jgi:hypothetical protein